MQRSQHEGTHFISLEQVLASIGCKKSFWYELIRQGVAPRPVKLGRRAVWPSYEIDSFRQRLIKQRDVEHGPASRGSLLADFDPSEEASEE